MDERQIYRFTGFVVVIHLMNVLLEDLFVFIEFVSPARNLYNFQNSFDDVNSERWIHIYNKQWHPFHFLEAIVNLINKAMAYYICGTSYKWNCLIKQFVVVVCISHIFISCTGTPTYHWVTTFESFQKPSNSKSLRNNSSEILW